MRKKEEVIHKVIVERLYCDDCGIKMESTWHCWSDCGPDYCENCYPAHLKKVSDWILLCPKCEKLYGEDWEHYEKYRKISNDYKETVMRKLKRNKNRRDDATEDSKKKAKV